MTSPNLVYQVFTAEDGSVALTGPDGEHLTYRTNWGDLIHYLRDKHWPEGGRMPTQDNLPATDRAWLPRVARASK